MFYGDKQQELSNTHSSWLEYIKTTPSHVLDHNIVINRQIFTTLLLLYDKK